MISILILTKNEAADLPGCLASVAWSDDIHVYDSYSSDSTLQIARNAGAHVTQRHFDNWSDHQNWGLRNIPFRHEWVFYIDADERMTPELADGVQQAVATAGKAVAFEIQRRDIFLGRWLKHTQLTSMYTRLFRPERIRYERLVNPVSIVDGSIGRLHGYLDHFPFSKGIHHWVERHNAYSTLEARQIMADRAAERTFSVRSALFAKELTTRRAHQKGLFYRMPLRPVTKFALVYILRNGFLDGKAGLTYATLQAFYEFMIVLKTQELEGPEVRANGARTHAAQVPASYEPAAAVSARYNKRVGHGGVRHE